MVDGAQEYRDAQQAQQARQQEQANHRAQILRDTHGGHSGPTGYSTNFEAKGGLDNLKNMISGADPDAMERVAGHYDSIQTSLTNAQNTLSSVTQKALQSWGGPASEGFLQRSSTLQQGLSNGAEYAQHTSTALTGAAGSLRTAKTKMDSLHDASWLSQKWHSFVDGSDDSGFKSDLKSGMSVDSALQLDGSSLNIEEQRHQQGVVAMQELGSQYNHHSSWLQNNTPPSVGDTSSVYPPPPSSTHSPVGGGYSDVANPNASGGSAGGGESFSSGGFKETPGVSPSTGLDGISGGIKTPTNASGWMNGSPAVGIGGMDPNGASRGFNGGLIGGGIGLGVGGLGRMAGLGGAAAESEAAQALEAGRNSVGGLGAGEGEAGAAAEEAALGKKGSSFGANAIGEEEGSGRGMMGGMGGLGRGNGKKKGRKARAGYLVEDEETWMPEDEGLNPPVIG